MIKIGAGNLNEVFEELEKEKGISKDVVISSLCDAMVAAYKKHLRLKEFPRLAVYRSTKHIYAQLIDDVNHVTLASASSNDKDIKEKLSHGGNIEAAKVVGEAIAQKAKKAGVECVVFDRGGFLYHGRVAALADAAREAGLMF